MGFPDVGEAWWRIEMGDEGLPQGVSTSRVAASVKPGRDWMPVPPITAMRTGSGKGKHKALDGSGRSPTTIAGGHDAGRER